MLRHQFLSTASIGRRLWSNKAIIGHAAPAPELSKLYVGQRLDVPYEVTVTDAWTVSWNSAFFQQDRIASSTEFAKSLGFQNAILPYSMMHFLCGSMSHIDESKEVMELGNINSEYLEPCYAGDTFRKVFHVRGLKAAKSGKSTVVTIKCDLYNQRDQKCFTLDKVMLYPVETHPNSHVKKAENAPVLKESNLLRRIKFGVSQLPGSVTTSSHMLLREGQLILHRMSRMVGKSMSWGLSTLFRLTHPLLYNSTRFKENDIVLSGGLVMAATLSSSNSDLFEVLNEEVQEVRFPNKAKPTDVISGITYVSNIRPLDTAAGSLEEASVCTIGLANVDTRTLEGVSLPSELFRAQNRESLEALCATHCPQLSGKIVCVALRKLVRTSPSSAHSQVFLL